MSETLASAAEKMGVPEALVKRSAEARAKATGSSTDDILAAWAGGEAAPAAPTPTPPPEEAETPAAEPAPSDAATAPGPEPDPSPEPERTGGAVVEPIAAPAQVTPREALDHPVVISVPTMGIAERTLTSVPRWLAVAFFVIPAFGLLHLAGSGAAGAACDDGDFLLEANFVTGDLQNCDGTDFEGRSAGGGAAEFLAIGTEQYASCQSCHGPNGEGGVGPAFGGVNTTFSSCLDHMEWVRLGTNGFRQQGMGTYGDLAKPVGGGGVMPPFTALTDEQLAAVVAFERIRFGGADPDETFVDCGLVEDAEEPAEGEEPTEGEEPAEGEEPSEEPATDAPEDTNEEPAESEAAALRRSG